MKSTLLARLRMLQMLQRSGRMAWRLIRDPRTPLLPKLILGAALLYVVSPLDLVPDVLPFLGQMDDVAVLALGLEMFFRSVPDWLRAEHESELGAPPGSSTPVATGRGRVVEGTARERPTPVANRPSWRPS